MTVSLTGVLLCAIIALGIVARLAFILAFRVRVLGRVTRHDHHASERRFDARGYEWDGFRDVWLRTTYDYKGVKYRNDVLVVVSAGNEPYPILRLWIDPANPNNVTAKGPAYWCVWLLLLCTFAILSWMLPF